MLALGIFLPEGAKVDQATLNKVIIEYVALDSLHSLGALHVHLMINGKLGTPVSHAVNLFFYVDLFDLCGRLLSSLHVTEPLSDHTLEHIVTKFAHENRPSQMHVLGVRAIVVA